MAASWENDLENPRPFKKVDLTEIHRSLDRRYLLRGPYVNTYYSSIKPKPWNINTGNSHVHEGADSIPLPCERPPGAPPCAITIPEHHGAERTEYAFQKTPYCFKSLGMTGSKLKLNTGGFAKGINTRFDDYLISESGEIIYITQRDSIWLWDRAGHNLEQSPVIQCAMNQLGIFYPLSEQDKEDIDQWFEDNHDYCKYLISYSGCTEHYYECTIERGCFGTEQGSLAAGVKLYPYLQGPKRKGHFDDAGGCGSGKDFWGGICWGLCDACDEHYRGAFSYWSCASTRYYAADGKLYVFTERLTEEDEQTKKQIFEECRDVTECYLYEVKGAGVNYFKIARRHSLEEQEFTISNDDAANKGEGKVGIPVDNSDFELLVDDHIRIELTDHYNGEYDIVETSEDEIVIKASYRPETFDDGNEKIYKIVQDVPAGYLQMDDMIKIEKDGTEYRACIDFIDEEIGSQANYFRIGVRYLDASTIDATSFAVGTRIEIWPRWFSTKRNNRFHRRLFVEMRKFIEHLTKAKTTFGNFVVTEPNSYTDSYVHDPYTGTYIEETSGRKSHNASMRCRNLKYYSYGYLYTFIQWALYRLAFSHVWESNIVVNNAIMAATVRAKYTVGADPPQTVKTELYLTSSIKKEFSIVCQTKGDYYEVEDTLNVSAATVAGWLQNPASAPSQCKYHVTQPAQEGDPYGGDPNKKQQKTYSGNYDWPGAGGVKEAQLEVDYTITVPNGNGVN